MEDKKQRNVKVELSTSPDDWKSVRECFVQSFRRYPLYKYIVPDDSKREAFLRAYLDANYEVTVGSGQGILLAIKVEVDEVVLDGNDNRVASKLFKVAGGVVFVPPADNGCGWAIGSDEPYWEAYEKHGLAEISKEGLERVKRYEAWENEQVGQKVSATRIPLWNGLFCAISPEYACKGVGTTGYKECIKIMAQYSIRRQKELLMAMRCKAGEEEAKKIKEDEEEEGFLGKLKKFLNPKQLHRFSLLNHRLLPQSSLFEKLDQTGKTRSVPKPQSRKSGKPAVDLPAIPDPPLLVAISQSDRAAHFHRSNGFQPVARIPFHDSVEESDPFFTHVLVLDPFRTGRISEFTAAMTGAGAPQRLRDFRAGTGQLVKDDAS